MNKKLVFGLIGFKPSAFNNISAAYKHRIEVKALGSETDIQVLLDLDAIVVDVVGDHTVNQGWFEQALGLPEGTLDSVKIGGTRNPAELEKFITYVEKSASSETIIRGNFG